MAQSKKKTSKDQLSVSQYEKLGRTLESIFEGGYINHHRVYKINFLRGIFFGVGTVIGGTVVIACLLWMLTLFSELPFVGEFADMIRNSIEQ